MLKRRLSKNTARAVGHNHNAQQPLHSNGGIGMSDNTNTVAAVPPKVVPANSLPALPSSTQNLVLNRRVYPNGCLKKTSSVKSTEREELLSSNNETIGRTTSANMHIKINTTMSVTSSNASVHTTSSTKSTSPPPPPPPMVSSTSSISSVQQQPVSTTDVEGVGNVTPPPPPHHQQHPQLEKKKSVSFQEVYIREFERILGDNPSCSSGAPISLGWKYAMDKSLPIDAYEERQSKYARRSRGSTSSSRHGAQDELILSRHDRESLLIEWGVTFNEMIDAIRTNVKIKNQRRRTVNAIGTYDRIEEMMENTASKLKGKLKLKKNSTGNGTVVASHNHGAAVTPTRTTISSKQQQKQKQRELLHSNHIPPANYTVAGRGSDHLSIRSIVSSDNSNSTSSVFGGSSSDKVSNSTTTSTSNVAVCFDEKNYKHRLGMDRTDTVSVDAVSEVNDFSTIVRTPASSIIDTKNDTHNTPSSNGSGDGVDTNPTTVVDTNTSANNDVNKDAVKISSTLYDLDDEIENELAAAATKKAQKKKYRSSSFDDRRSNMNVNEDSIIPRRPPSGATTKVVLEPIIGVDIPRDVKLQRSMSIESGLTYDPHLMSAENNYDYCTVQKVNDDDISTLAYDIEHDTTDYQDGTEQEGTDQDATDNEDVTMPSKFLQEFNELMMADSHPNLLNNTINRSDEYDFSNAPKSALPGTLPTNELLHQPEKSRNTFPVDSRSTYNRQPLHANTYYAIGEDNQNENNLDYNTAKSLMTETEYDEIYLQIAEHPLSPVSELTGMDRFQNSFTSRSTASSYMYRKLHPEDGDFDKLQRDSSFWGICPGEHDAPELQRVMMPVVITEDASVGQSDMNHFDTQANELSRISEGQHYMNNSDYRYQSDHDVHVNTSYPNMMFSNREMIPSQQIGNMGLPSQYMHPISGIPIPNLMNSQNAGLMHQHRQHDISINNGMMQHHFPNALYPTPQYPSPLLVPTSAYASTIESYGPPELMYNIENGQHQYRLNERHAPMYNYETETVDIANTQRWDDHGFRMEPPPNSTTLLHKMMM